MSEEKGADGDSKDKGKGRATSSSNPEESNLQPESSQNEAAAEELDSSEPADPKQVEDILRALNLTSRLPGAVSLEFRMPSSLSNHREQIVSGKKQKDMNSYQFWKGQPVLSFGKLCYYSLRMTG